MISNVFARLNPKKVMVIGDLMLDAYTVGSVSRISPEAPVPILRVLQESSRAGGAGNVVLNLVSLGAEVFAVGRVGADVPGQDLKENLSFQGVEVEGIFVDTTFRTPLKNRVIAENQQIIRVDHEKITPTSSQVEEKIRKYLSSKIPQVDVVALSDYNKGLFSEELTQAAITIANEHNIPILVDPKGVSYKKYRGCTLLKPNLKEAYDATSMEEHEAIEDVAEKLIKEVSPKHLMVTRSEKGISLFSKKLSRADFPTRVKEVNDVTGAGDTVLATMCFALANKLGIEDCIELSNLAAGIAVEHFGCARVSLSEIAQRLLKEKTTNKIFKEDYLYVLKEAVKGKSFTVLGVHNQDQLDQDLFKAIRELRAKIDGRLLVYVRHLDPDPDPEFISLLASLLEIDFIVLKKESLVNLCGEMKPAETWVFEKGNLSKEEFSKVAF
jgi:D-glycero-beta-D-manno-heptose-7-phosphate kinase